jgi:hypothetical protein
MTHQQDGRLVNICFITQSFYELIGCFSLPFPSQTCYKIVSVRLKMRILNMSSQVF